METKFIKLQCNCPPSCLCGGKQVRNWHHQECHEQSYINCQGDIFCMNAKRSGKCEGYFIQNAKFQCEQAKQQGNTWMQFRAASEFLMGIAQAMQSAKFEIKDENEILQFGNTLSRQIMQRWLR